MKVQYFSRLRTLPSVPPECDSRLGSLIGSKVSYSGLTFELYFVFPPEYRSILFEHLRKPLTGRLWSFSSLSDMWGSIQIPLVNGETGNGECDAFEEGFKTALQAAGAKLSYAWGKEIEVEKITVPQDNTSL